MKNSFNSILSAGAALVSLSLTPTAWAGCGRSVLAGFLPPATALVRRADAVSPGEPRAAEAANYQSIVGLWLSTLTVGGQTFGVAFESFTSDGIEILNDNGAPQAGNVCLGVWAPTGRSSLKINHPSWNLRQQWKRHRHGGHKVASHRRLRRKYLQRHLNH